MSPFIRIKNHVINLQNLAYISVEINHIDFGFAFPVREPGVQNYIRFEKGSDLQEAEFEEVKEFVLQLPDPDRVVAV